MAGMININKNRTDNFGRVMTSTKSLAEFAYLLNRNVNDIVLFDNGTEQLKDDGKIILPRHYVLFIGNKDGESQYKSYEYNKYRIVVSTYKDIIVSIDSIG